jgi:glucose/arabinose dehydrogenase
MTSLRASAEKSVAVKAPLDFINFYRRSLMKHKPVLVCLAILCCLLLGPVAAQTFTDPGFTSEVVTSLPAYQPVGLTWAPDGRMFIWQEKGVVRIYKNGTLLPTPFLDISSKVNTVNDRGLLGLALDPNFATNGYVYLFYTYEPNGNPNDTSPKTSRLTRVTANPTNPDVMLANSEIIILGSIGAAPCSQYPAGSDCIGSDSVEHTADTLRFGPDGKLYVSLGDGASSQIIDPLALRAQDLNAYNGKLLRINADGTAPADNPFYDGNPASIRSRVYSYGLRNPYRFGIHPTTGEVIIGDVGWLTYEEINRGRGANFGWPCFEGNDPQSDYQAAFATCRALSASAVTKPLYVYSHTDTQAFGGAVIGGAFYTATQFPTQYRGNFFFGEYVGQYINRIVFDANNNVSSVVRFASNLGGIVSLEQGPDGALYYIELVSGQVRRLRYVAVASTPVAVASASPTSGVSPLTVNFSSAGSNDPGGSPLTYLWDFGDGTPTSTAANPTHTYSSSTAKTFTARLTVTNNQGNSASATVAISVGLQSPIATITSPRNKQRFKVGATVTYTGTATDPDGVLTASNFSWQVLLHHNEHVHLYTTTTGTTGSFVVENHGTATETYFYEIILTVTDSSGLKDVERVIVDISKARK